jgi:hypothetical protein
MPLRSGLICARLTVAARRSMGGIVTLGSGTLPAGVPAEVVLLLPATPTPTLARRSSVRGHRQDGQGRALLARLLGCPRPPAQTCSC